MCDKLDLNIVPGYSRCAVHNKLPHVVDYCLGHTSCHNLGQQHVVLVHDLSVNFRDLVSGPGT